VRELFTRPYVSTVEAVNEQDLVVIFDRPAVVGTDERYLFSVLKVNEPSGLTFIVLLKLV
jgi:hypothetical protein